jgi:hypothetical protein
MQTDDFEHLTHREWREILRWRAWDAKIALDQAVEARRKAVAKYRAGEGVTLEEWTDLRQALGTESKTRQKYHNALEDYNSSSPNMVPTRVPANPPRGTVCDSHACAASTGSFGGLAATERPQTKTALDQCRPNPVNRRR